jgi:hypothetical protein
MTRLTDTKNGYQSMLHTYLQRRDNLRKKYNWQPGKSNCPEYGKAVLKIRKKINVIQKRLRAIEQREQRLRSISEMLEEFLGYNVHFSLRHDNPNQSWGTAPVARGIFYKYCLENGHQGSEVARFVGAKARYTASEGRLAFTRSFKQKPERKELYHRFCAFLREMEPKTARMISLPAPMAEAI